MKNISNSDSSLFAQHTSHKSTLNERFTEKKK